MMSDHLRYALPIVVVLWLLIMKQVNSASTYASWLGPRASLIQGSIFIEGGLILRGNFTGGKFQNSKFRQQRGGNLFNLSLCSSFDIAKINTDNLLVPVEEINDNSAPVWIAGAMFANNHEFFTFGGLPSSDRGTYRSVMNGQMFQPNPAATNFEPGFKTEFVLPGNVSDNIAAGAYVSAPSERLAFMFSGLVSASGGVILYNAGDGDSPTHVNRSSSTFLKADLSQMHNITFQNLTIPSWITPRSQASMVWLPFGTQGVLLVIGGVQRPADLFGGSGTTASAFMTDILVYDIGRNQWSMQRSLEEPGTSPTQLAGFCSVVAETQDKTSYSIYVYGGYDGAYDPDVSAKDEVWVLSIPSFQWTKVSLGIYDHRRKSHVCVAPNPTTMISIGGVKEYDQPLGAETNIDVFDLNSLNWTGRYDSTSDAPYVLPDVIAKQIGGKPTGGIAIPSLNSSLASLFSQRYAKPIAQYYPYNCGAVVNTATILNESPSPAWRTPVIATVCTVAVTALIAGLAFFLYRRNRQDKENAATKTRTRRNVLQWLRKSNLDDQMPEKSQSSGETVVGDLSEYFASDKNPDATVHEAPSDTITTPGFFSLGSPPFMPYSPPRSGSVEVDTQSRYEIMDNPRGSMSISHHPLYPRSLYGDFVRSVRSNSETISYPSGQLVPYNLDLAVRGRSGSVSPYELPQDKSDEDLSQPPNDLLLDEPNRANEPRPFADERTTPISSPTATRATAFIRKQSEYATPAQSPIVEKRPSLVAHHCHHSSLSSTLPNLPSPAPEEEHRMSKAIDELPDRKSSSIEIPQQPTKKRSGPLRSAYHENFEDEKGENEIERATR